MDSSSVLSCISSLYMIHLGGFYDVTVTITVYTDYDRIFSAGFPYGSKEKKKKKLYIISP